MGAVYLAGYVVLVGVATFLLKFGLKDLDPYQLNLLMGIAMLITGVPALWLADRSLSLPRRGLVVGGGAALFMAVGSILYVLALSKLPAGATAAIATSYVAIVIVLSRIVLHERIDAAKLVGLALTIAGVAILSYKS